MTFDEFQKLKIGESVLIQAWGPNRTFLGKVTHIHLEVPFDYIEILGDDGKKWRMPCDKIQRLPTMDEVEESEEYELECLSKLSLCDGRFPVLDALSSTVYVVDFLRNLGHHEIADKYKKTQHNVRIARKEE